MFIKSFFTSLRGAVDAPRPLPLFARALPLQIRADSAARVASYTARAHFVVAWRPDWAMVAVARGSLQAGGARRFTVNPLRRAPMMIARVALWIAYVRNPFTPNCYVVLAMTVAAAALVAMLSTSPLGNALERGLWLNGLFS